MQNLKEKTEQPNSPADTIKYYYTSQASLQTSNLLITLLVASLAFCTGYFFSQVKYLQSGKTLGAATQPQGTQQAAAAQPTEVPIDANSVKEVFNTEGIIKFGNTNSKLLIVEGSDPSCPYCSVASGENATLAQQAGLTYKDAGGTYLPPLTNIRQLVEEGKAAFATFYMNGHGSGELAMQALYCAYEKGVYWEAHDLLMNNDGYTLINNEVKNDKANASKLADYLSGVIDPTFLTECLTTGKYADRLAKEQELGRKLGGSGTPFFIVGSTPFRGAYSYSDMESAVKTALGE
jgi:protein-disulfide isomerase